MEVDFYTDIDEPVDLTVLSKFQTRLYGNERFIFSGKMMNRYFVEEGRFNVTEKIFNVAVNDVTETHRIYNLTIRNVQLRDSGKYICHDDGGTGHIEANVQVLGTFKLLNI